MSDLRKLLENLDPGPWKLSVCTTGEDCWCRIVECPPVTYPESPGLVRDWVAASGSLHRDDAEFLVAVRNELPAILDELDAVKFELRHLQGDMERLRRENDQLHDANDEATQNCYLMLKAEGALRDTKELLKHAEGTLYRYGGHSGECSKKDPGDPPVAWEDRKCSCGWDAAIDKLKGAVE